MSTPLPLWDDRVIEEILLQTSLFMVIQLQDSILQVVRLLKVTSLWMKPCQHGLLCECDVHNFLGVNKY